MGGGASSPVLLSGEVNTPIISWADLCEHQKPVEGSEELPLHLRGISGHLLLALIHMPEFRKEWTTGNFCHEHIIPLTKQFKSSFVRMAETLHVNGKSSTGTPTRFLSHTWGYPIHRTISAALESPEGGLDVYYWFDIFCLNQHSNEIGHPDFNTFLRNAMQQTSHTLFVCSPWNRPVSITRAWCLYEVMESLKPENKMKFTPVLDPEEINDFTRALLEDTSALLEIFINVNAKKASAYMKEDLDMIFGWIESSIGIDSLNAVLKKGLCDWLRKAGTEAVDQRVSRLQAQLEEEVRISESTEVSEVPTVRGSEQLQEEERRLVRRKELLIEDLDRFDHVEPLEQTEVLDVASLEAATSQGLSTVAIPVMLGTTGHHSFEHAGGMCGGVLPAFLQILVSHPAFRRDVHLGTDSKGQSRTSESRFHSELRNVCALWEKAQDGIISLDMLVDKLPDLSKQLCLQPSDFSEFVNTVLTENEALQEFWPLFSTDTVMWYQDAEGVRHHKIRGEEMHYLQTSVSRDTPNLADQLKVYFSPEEMEGCHWRDEANSNPSARDVRSVTVQRGSYWKKQPPGGSGRIAVMLNRFDMDYSTFQVCFNTAPCVIPSELSMSGLEYRYQPPSPSSPPHQTDEHTVPLPEPVPVSDSLSDDLIYRPKGIITYHRHGIENEDDTCMGSGAVFETYIEVEGLWWFISEYKQVVRLVSWEIVQKEASKCAFMVLFDSESTSSLTSELNNNDGNTAS